MFTEEKCVTPYLYFLRSELYYESLSAHYIIIPVRSFCIALLATCCNFIETNNRHFQNLKYNSGRQQMVFSNQQSIKIQATRHNENQLHNR